MRRNLKGSDSVLFKGAIQAFVWGDLKTVKVFLSSGIGTGISAV
jgi:hypothetical protein